MLGIDVSKDTLACTLFDAQTQKPLWSRTVANTSTGVARLLKQTPTDSPWALEPTGRAGQPQAGARFGVAFLDTTEKQPAGQPGQKRAGGGAPIECA